MKLFVVVIALLVAVTLAEHDLLSILRRGLDRDNVKVNLNINVNYLAASEGHRSERISGSPYSNHQKSSIVKEDMNSLNLGNSRPRRNKGYDNFYFLPSRG